MNNVFLKKNSEKSKNTRKAIITIIICTLLTAAGQVLMKYSTSGLDNLLDAITNIPLIGGLIIYAVASVLLITALKNAELSIVYPFIALSFVWVTILSIILFNEQVSLINTLGIIAIIIGVSFIGRSGG
jgi:undecaprenyl phosphate-alpha-L-ara4N flippase subunit ArnE